MSGIDLEDRLEASLRRRAGAPPPPTDAARRRVDERTHAARRRRDLGRGMAAAAAVTLVVGAGMWLRSGDEDGATSTASEGAVPMAPAHRGAWPEPPAPDVPGGPLPDFAVDGFERIQSSQGEPDDVDASGGPPTSHQTFREPGNYSGPLVGVVHFGDCGECDGLRPGLPDADGEQVSVGDRPGQLWTLEPDGRILTWTLGDGSVVYLSSRDLTTPEVLAFARGLERQASLGFDARELPQGLAESTLETTFSQAVERRLVDVEDRDGRAAQILVGRGGSGLLAGETGPFNDGAFVDQAEHVTVLGRPAVLLHRTDPERWMVVWRHTTEAVGLFQFAAPDLSAAQRIVAGIREVREIREVTLTP